MAFHLKLRRLDASARFLRWKECSATGGFPERKVEMVPRLENRRDGTCVGWRAAVLPELRVMCV